jgi:nucleosome binding factor SPN SPT16 subunit
MIANVLAVKDEVEINNIKRASELTTTLFGKYLKEQIINAIDAEKKVKHVKLSEGVENALGDSKYIPQTDLNNVEVCYPAIIQSGGNYNLKFSASPYVSI